MSLTSILPAPKQAFGPVMDIPTPTTMVVKDSRPAPRIPLYGKRLGWVPRMVEDFGDGGAFPEIHVAQYPLDMGRKKKAVTSTSVVPLTLDSTGKIKYDALITQGQTPGKTVFSKFTDLVEKHVEESELSRPSEEEVAETTAKTRAALESLVNGKIVASHTSAPVAQKAAPTYIRYTPAQQNPAHNSGASNRIIKMVEMPVDPLEPPKFKHKKAPRGPPSPPVPVMHSPPRKLTVKDQQEWKIPPCISNWKNAKGYTIPLDKRLAADGRGLSDTGINDNFAKLSEALYIAERNARDEVAKRASIQKKLALKEKEKKEELLRRLAQQAREERKGVAQEEEQAAEEAEAMDVESEGDDDPETAARKAERDRIREERRRDRERERRLSAKKSKLTRDEDRDISEKIALGQAGAPPSQETLYDQRLFSQSQGMDSGFGTDDSYSVYSKPLFSGSSANILYRPKKSDGDAYGDQDLDSLVNTGKFKPDKDFDGVDRSKPSEPRSRPVEFEKEEDPFGLDAFLHEAKSSKKGNALDKIGKSGFLHAGAAGGGSKEEYSSSSSKRNIEFEKKGSGSRR
jgi:SNW domain-containing protein 1